MPTYEVTLKDRTVEVIEGADAYQQEGQMTTFFATAADRSLVDSWSTRIASFRTSEILVIRRQPAAVVIDVTAPQEGENTVHLRSA